MGVPVGLVREGFIDAVVKVFVVGEDDMAADVVELGVRLVLSSQDDPRLTKPSGVASVEARPPGVSLESMIIHEGPSCFAVNPVRAGSGSAIVQVD